MIISGRIPEGYKDLSTKPEAGGKRKIKIQAPNGKTFSTIRKAQEYYVKSMNSEDKKGKNSSYYDSLYETNSCNIM